MLTNHAYNRLASLCQAEHKSMSKQSIANDMEGRPPALAGTGKQGVAYRFIYTDLHFTN